MISAVVLVHNDEKTLPSTLSSLAWCNEIIVINDSSTDGSPELAKKSGAKVFDRPLEADFAAQRNFGLSKARGDWVFFVDSDETVPVALRDEILITLNNTTSSGFMLKREDILFGRRMKYGETADVRLLRLAKKNAGKWVRPVHEVWEIEGEVGQMSNPIEHTPHETISEFLTEINRYTTMNANYLYLQNIQEPVINIVLFPVAKFFKNYIVLKGYKDSTQGMILAIMMSFHSFLTRSKLFLLWHKQTVPLPTNS